MKIKKLVSILSFFLTLSLIALISVSHAATISGSIYESDGTTLITGTSIQVVVYQGDPCGWRTWVANVNTTTGTYTTLNLSEGTYYLQTNNMSQSNYVNEWWADSASTISCNGAQSITVSTEDVTGKNFQLDVGYSISGTVYQSDGFTPIPDNSVRVEVYTGNPCEYRQWIDSSETSVGAYTIMGIPPGIYYLQTSNMNQSNYVNEWWADTFSVIPCSSAQSVTVSTVNIIGKDFQLDDGYSISGMVYQSDGSTPIPDNNVWVEVYTGDPCDDREYMGNAETSVGAYTFMGIPPGDYYLQTRSNNQSIYAGEWWAESESVFYCSEAQTVTVVDTNVIDKNYQLDIGGSITGVVFNDSGVPQADLAVEYDNDLCSVWKSVNTAVDGSFEIIGLPPGPVEIEIEPDVDTGLVMYMRTHSCLALGENSDLGTIELQYGALITGILQDAVSNPLSDVEFWCGAKFEVAQGDTDVDGSFALRIPVGTYTLNFGLDEDEHSALPEEITVSDVGTPQDLGVFTAYDSSSGEIISGSVNYGGYADTGEFIAVAFLNTTEFTPDIFGGISSLAEAEPDQVTGEYSLYVVPQAERPGTMVNVMLILFHEGTDGWESLTLVDEIENIVTGGSPVGGQNLAYSTLGSDYTVSGFVKNGEGGIVDATVLLYKQPGDEFFGFAKTDCDGAYAFYNVPAGTYRIAVTAYGHDTTEWTASYNLVDTNIAIPDIFMGSFGDELALDFGPAGLWDYDGTNWAFISGSSPEDMTGWSGGLAMDFGASGLWNYDGSTWTPLSGSNIEDMADWANGLAADFGASGVWNYDGTTWTSITGSNPEDMAGWSDGLAMDFAASGVWSYDGSTWTPVSGSSPDGMLGWSEGLALDFGASGLWSYDGSSWNFITGSNVEGMANWSNGLSIDFGTSGVWNYDGSSWAFISGGNPEDMLGWSSGLAMDFGASGVWSYDGAAWSFISGSNCEDMDDVDLY